MIFHQNRGMFTETLVDNTIEWYLRHSIAFFRKNHLPIKIKKVNYDSHDIHGRLVSKASVDFYGVFKGQFIEFEVKETNQSFFNFNNLKKHQFYNLQLTSQYQGIAFILINFTYYETILLLEMKVLNQIKLSKKSKWTFEQLKKIAKIVPLEFPGIIDWLKIINYKGFEDVRTSKQ